jgi:hypothetical protein
MKKKRDAKYKQNLLREVAYHEAGHAVAFYYLGRPFQEASIIPTRRTLGYVRSLHNPCPRAPVSEFKVFVEKTIVLLYAGQIAEEKFLRHLRHRRPCRNASEREDGSEPDNRLALRCAELMAKHCSGKTSGDLILRLYKRSEHFVRSHWREIGWVAEQLVKDRRLTYKDVVAVIASRRRGTPRKS